jgi:hypothetical protein
VTKLFPKANLSPYQLVQFLGSITKLTVATINAVKKRMAIDCRTSATSRLDSPDGTARIMRPTAAPVKDDPP